MKNQLTLKIMVILWMLISSLKSEAQITITDNDFVDHLLLGQVVTTYLDTSTIQIDIGSPGLTSWDFSGIASNYEFETESKTYSSSPYTAEFPGAEYASYYEGIFEGSFSKTWVYNTVNNYLISHGTGTVANTVAGTIKTIITFNPGKEEYVFPIQYENTHTYIGTQTIATTIPIAGFGDYTTTLVQNVTVNQVVDAYGVVTMPDGKKLNALRIKKETILEWDGNISTTVSYTVITKTGEFVSFTPSDANVTSGITTVDGISWTSGKGTGIVETTVAAPVTLPASVSNGAIVLNWTDNSDNEQGFNIERAQTLGTNTSLKSNGNKLTEGFSVIATVDANVVTYTDTTAEPGVEYIYRIQAFNGDTTSEYSNEISASIEIVIESVEAPSALMASAGIDAIELEWTDNSTNETGFNIERAEGSGSFALLASVGANEVSYTDNSAIAGIEYSYRIQAFNADTTSAYSNEVKGTVEIVVVTEPIEAPSALSATVNAEAIELGWTDNSNNETGFTIERAEASGSFTVLTSLGANVTTYTDNTVTAGVEYTYRVQAINADTTSAYSNEVKATVEIVVVIEPIEAPSALSAAVNGEAIELGWTDNSNNETGFSIERADASGSFTVLTSLGANVATFTDNTVTAGVEYTYRVQAINADTISDYSNEVKATVEIVVVIEAIEAPSALSATVNGDGIELGWTDNSNNETGFSIERAEASGSFTVLTSLGANVTTYTDNTVTAGVEYTYRVQAINADTTSEYSNEVKATVEIVIVIEPIEAPSALFAIVNGEAIELGWTDNSNNETGFTIERAEASGSFTVLTSLGANLTTFTDNTVTAGVEYIYRVQAINTDTISDYSNEVSAKIEETGIELLKVDLYDKNYPNPFSENTTIEFTLSESDFISLRIFDMKGSVVSNIVESKLDAGKHTFNFDASKYDEGIYFYNISSNKFSKMKKMMLVK